MRLTIVNLLISGANGRGTERSASILARMPQKMNPPYVRRRTAAEAAYRWCEGSKTIGFSRRPCGKQGRQIPSPRHFAVPHRRARGQAFRRVDDGVGVDAVVAVEIID